MRQRVLSALVLLPFGLTFIYLGGWLFNMLILMLLGMAGWEYSRIFRQGGYAPATALIIAGSVMLALFRALFGFQYSDALITALVLIAMAWHVFSFENGNEKPGSSFAITLGGIFYLGWLGAYFISLRGLPHGLYWFLLALPVIWLADTGAYLIGRKLGRHQMAHRTSPKKSWEGYAGGILAGMIGGALLAVAWSSFNPVTTLPRGLLLGLALSSVTPLGDLGESMMKREFGVKDSSNLIPGHGGLMDRIDSWLWACAISYYMITWLW